MKQTKLVVGAFASAMAWSACSAENPEPEFIGQQSGTASPSGTPPGSTAPGTGGVLTPGPGMNTGVPANTTGVGTAAPTTPPTTTVPGATPTTGGGTPSTTAPPATSMPGTTAPPDPGTAPGMVSCSNTDLSVLPIDETGWVYKECNNAGLQGAFYCYDDGVNESGCTPDTPPYVPGAGMCLSGVTTEDETFAAWGAGIGFSLNESGDSTAGAGDSVKSGFDAEANGLLGFAIKITGDTGGNKVRINFTRDAEPDGVSPFVEVPGASDTAYDVMIADALVPEAWEACEGDACFADPNAVYDIQIQLVGGETDSSYDFCVESVTPITDGSTPVQPGAGGGAVQAYGSALCDAFATTAIGPYMVQNNAYNGASHCVTARWDNGSKGGFSLTNVNANVAVGGAPASYPSLVYGWHVDGNFHGGYSSARALSSITSIPSEVSFTVPGAGRYNMAYDNWIKNSPTSADDQGTLEQMIWLNYRETTPIGESVDSVNIGGQQWDVWYGPNEGFNTVSYIRATNTTTFNMDLKAFMDDTVARGYAQAGDYLLGVQAGFEIWEASQEFSIDSFSVSVQ